MPDPGDEMVVACSYEPTVQDDFTPTLGLGIEMDFPALPALRIKMSIENFRMTLTRNVMRISKNVNHGIAPSQGVVVIRFDPAACPKAAGFRYVAIFADGIDIEATGLASKILS